MTYSMANASPKKKSTVHKAPVSIGGESSDDNASLDILTMLLPPREWEESSGKWLQYASPHKPTRDEVHELHESISQRLNDRQARTNGICPVRENIFSQAFGESSLCTL